MEYWLVISAGLAILFLYFRGKPFQKPVKKMKRLWLPGYSVFYSDVKNKNHPGATLNGKLLVSEKYGLQGKPDYIYKKGNALIPVELKSGTAEKLTQPREGDVMQLAAYFFIIRDLYGHKPRSGYLVYSDCVFKIKNTRHLGKRLFTVLSEMREMLVTGEGYDNASFMTCKHCICRGTVCDRRQNGQKKSNH